MIQHRTIGIILSVGALGWSSSALAQTASVPTTQVTIPSTGTGVPVAGIEINLLRSLQANPATSLYTFATERRGSKIALRGRVGTKQAHDAAIQTAIALGVPVIDDLVIDTLAVHQAGAYQSAYAARMGYRGPGMGYGSAGPSSGLGGYPGATSLYTSLPYTYPQPLFGRLDEPFFGFEPPVLGYPAWWGAMSAARVGLPNQAASNQQQQQGMDPNASMANPQADPAAAQAANLPIGTIDMEIDGRGVATLRGTVPTFAERITLGQKVARTPGVVQVINLLNVDPKIVVATVSDKPPPPPVPADLQAGPAAPVPGLPEIPNNNVGPDRVDTDPVGLRATKAIANRAGLANQSIKVKVRDGVASLSGKVPTVFEAMLAYRAVQRTPGVREIDDRLEFTVPDGNGPNPLADKGRPEDVEPYLEAQLRRQVGDLAHIDRVRLQGDSLELRGTLEREDDRARFDAIIRSMPILRGFRVTADMPAESR
jgi:osmotically-inducible protein OsmY